MTVHLCLHENGKSMKGDDVLIFTQYTRHTFHVSVISFYSGSEMSKEGDSRYHKCMNVNVLLLGYLGDQCHRPDKVKHTLQ